MYTHHSAGNSPTSWTSLIGIWCTDWANATATKEEAEGRVEVIADRSRVPGLDSTVLSLDLDLIEDGIHVNESRHLFLHEHSVFIDPSHRAGWYVPTAHSVLGQWSLRVRGGSRDVLHSLRAEHYWDGEFVIPLAELQGR